MKAVKEGKKKSNPNSWEVVDPQIKQSLLGSGIYQYTLFSQNSLIPLGMVWTVFLDESILILHSYTVPFARGCGVRSLIQKHLESMKKRIITGPSSSSGRRFLQKSGFVFQPSLRMFVKSSQ